jgi:hypothetical protein
MKKLLRRLPLKGEATPLKDTTPENATGTTAGVHRRKTVTFERETLSVIVRRPVAAPSDAASTHIQPGPEQILAGRERK